MKLQKYCMFMLYICFLISLISTIGSYIFESKDFISSLCSTVAIGSLTMSVHSTQNNHKKSNEF